MRFYRPPIIGSVFRTDRSAREWSIPKRMLLVGVPLLAAVLACFAFVTYKVGAHYLTTAYSRNSLTRAKAQAHEIASRLETARNELLFMADGILDPKRLARYLQGRTEAEGLRYREIAFQGNGGKDDAFVLLNTGRGVVSIPPDTALATRFGPFTRQSAPTDPQPGQVYLSQPLEVIYPSVPVPGGVQTLPLHVIRLSTPVFAEDGTMRGMLLLSLDVVALRNVLSLYASQRSPLHIYPQESERYRSFMFDPAGWILFQSESPDLPDADLSNDVVRSGLQGDLGRTGLDIAFRPGPENENYWAMVSEVQAGRAGLSTLGSRFADAASLNRSSFVSYVPIVFRGGPGQLPSVYAGLGFIDTSFMVMASSYKLAGALSVALGLGVFVITIVMVSMGVRIARPLIQLANAIENKAAEDDMSPMQDALLPREAHLLRKGVNMILARLREVVQASSLHDARSLAARKRQKVCFDTELAVSASDMPDPDSEKMPGIVGVSPAVKSLRALIRKAASIAADVLIIGETGTGKELTAEAIHANSSRAKGPFVSINCGALDENLLLDALFGHVKGAFSEAKGERKGAFLAADGGTLHLDEIGNASPKVQQALLRALSVRRIRPLGSDDEIGFDARIIAATNVDLLESAGQGAFREDLYYRLAVITIKTPPLRERREDIPALAGYFIKLASVETGRTLMGLSRGALDALLRYPWPGNVREIRNVITRAVAFAESDIIYEEDLRFGFSDAGAEASAEADPVAAEWPGVPGLSGMPGSVTVASAGGHQQGRAGTGAGLGGEAYPSSGGATGMTDASMADVSPNGGGEGVGGFPVASFPADGGAFDDAARPRRRSSTMGRGYDAPPAGDDAGGAPPTREVVERSMQGDRARPGAALRDADVLASLNPRQQSVWPRILREGGITRSAYQQALGAEVSVRTAQYDLQDFMKRGVLAKVGRGPASRYVLTEDYRG